MRQNLTFLGKMQLSFSIFMILGFALVGIVSSDYNTLKIIMLVVSCVFIPFMILSLCWELRFYYKSYKKNRKQMKNNIKSVNEFLKTNSPRWKNNKHSN